MAAQQSPQALPYEVEQPLGAGKKSSAEIGGMGTATAALEQRDAKPALERSNCLRHRGLGKTYQRRCAADAVVPRHGLEHAQLPEAGEVLGGLHGNLRHL